MDEQKTNKKSRPQDPDTLRELVAWLPFLG